MLLAKCLIIATILSKISACNVSPGSYPYAEEYELDYPLEEVKTAINKFKEEHSEFVVPKVTIENKGAWDLPDAQSQDNDQLYYFYFYYKSENKIVLTWIRPLGKNRTTFAFVSINDGLDIGNWKNINKDFSNSENREEKKKFETNILAGIKAKMNTKMMN